MGRCRDVFGTGNRDSQNQVVAGVAFVQVGLMLIINIYGFCRMRQAKKRLALVGYEEPRENTFLLPIYTKLMWATCGALLLDALIHYVAPFSIVNPNRTANSVLNGLAYAVKHFCFEVVAFFLMSPSAGQRSIIKAIIFAFAWSLITFGLKTAYTYNVSINPRYSTSFDLLWLSMLLAFYYVVWLFPGMHILFRRPAVRFYAAFWAILHSLFMLSTVLRYFSVDGGYCLYISNSALLLGFCPWAVYKVCKDDSLYWQGGNKLANDETRIQAMVQDNTVGQAVAANVAMADDSNVKVINFVSLTIHMDNDEEGNPNDWGVVGQGTYARVYQGLYRGSKVAIKLIYAPELTQEIVSNLMKEAATLQALRYKHVVKVEGVCIMPPALALVMELCKTSLFSYLHPEKEFEQALEREKQQRVEMNGVLVSSSQRPQIKDGRLQSAQGSFALAGNDPQEDDGEERPLPQLLEPLPLLEQVRLMLECAKAVYFLHDRPEPVVHLDIKSGNFLLADDENMTVRIADFELATRAYTQKSAAQNNSARSLANANGSPPPPGVTEEADVGKQYGPQKEDVEPPQPVKLNWSCADCATCQEGGALATGLTRCLDCVTKCLGSGQDLLDKNKIIVPEAPNWLAPELMDNPNPEQNISPACDIYSLGCVFWEIVTRRVPFEELAVHFHEYNAAVAKAKKEYHNRRAREAREAAARAAENPDVTSAPHLHRRSVHTYPSRAAAEAAAASAPGGASKSTNPNDIPMDELGSRSTNHKNELQTPTVTFRGLGAYPSRAVPPWTKRRSTFSDKQARPKSASTMLKTGASWSTSSIPVGTPAMDPLTLPSGSASKPAQETKQDSGSSNAASVVVTVPDGPSSAIPTVQQQQAQTQQGNSTDAIDLELTAPPEAEGIACYDDTAIPLYMEEQFDVQKTMYDWIKLHDYRPPIPSDIPREIRWCIQMAWSGDPHLRPSAKKLVQVLTSLYHRLQQQQGCGLSTSGSVIPSNLREGGVLEQKDSIVGSVSTVGTLSTNFSDLALRASVSGLSKVSVGTNPTNSNVSAPVTSVVQVAASDHNPIPTSSRSTTPTPPPPPQPQPPAPSVPTLSPVPPQGPPPTETSVPQSPTSNTAVSQVTASPSMPLPPVSSKRADEPVELKVIVTSLDAAQTGPQTPSLKSANTTTTTTTSTTTVVRPSPPTVPRQSLSEVNPKPRPPSEPRPH